MTRTEANIILDLRRAGADIDPAVIDAALVLTGDLECVGDGEGV